MNTIKTFSKITITAIFALSAIAPLAALAQTYDPPTVAAHNTAGDCWMIISGKVYNVTSYIPSHPGGSAMVPFCGLDATTALVNHPTISSILPSYYIGDLAVPQIITSIVVAPATSSIPVSGTSQFTATALDQNSSSLVTQPVFTWVSSNSAVASVSATGLATGLSVGGPITITASSNSISGSASLAVTATSTPDSQVPSTPTNLAASAVSSSRIDLSWVASTDNIGTAGYFIYRDGTKIATTTAVSYSSTGLNASTTYSYMVIAFDGAGNLSAQSNVASAKTLGSASTTCNGDDEDDDEDKIGNHEDDDKDEVEDQDDRDENDRNENHGLEVSAASHEKHIDKSMGGIRSEGRNSKNNRDHDK